MWRINRCSRQPLPTRCLKYLRAASGSPVTDIYNCTDRMLYEVKSPAIFSVIQVMAAHRTAAIKITRLAIQYFFKSGFTCNGLFQANKKRFSDKKAAVFPDAANAAPYRADIGDRAII